MLVDTLVVLDFETTGLRPDQGDRITEVAAVRLQQGTLVSRYESLVNCERRLPAHIRNFTGITQRMVDTAPPAWQVFPELLRFIGNDAVVSHNGAFDQGFLEVECERLNLSRSGGDFLCTVQLARKLLPELSNYSLHSLNRYFHLPATAQHRAGLDAAATAQVLLKLCEVAAGESSLMRLDGAYLRSLARPIIEAPQPRDATARSA